MEEQFREIQVYVDLEGKNNQHSSLSGRDEANQHSISAITNLQNILDTITQHFTDNDTKINIIEQDINSIEFEIRHITEEQETCIKLKGVTESQETLPQDNAQGDVYKISTEPTYYIWNGENWDLLGGVAALKDYAKTDYVDASIAECISLVKQYTDQQISLLDCYSKEEVDFLLNYKVDKGTVYTKEEIQELLKDTILSTTWLTYEDIIT